MKWISVYHDRPPMTKMVLMHCENSHHRYVWGWMEYVYDQPKWFTRWGSTLNIIDVETNGFSGCDNTKVTHYCIPVPPEKDVQND